MAAFDRVCSGIPEMDKALDNIRMGDNVVWQVADLDEFRMFAEPFADQAIKDGRNLIYVRFASHDPILTPRPGLKIVEFQLSYLFETFTIEIHNLIEKEGRDAFYVFDCLSELQTAWSTDLMMGNFFHLTCPFLFILDTVAFFPVIRGNHSFQAIAKIRDTTQLFLDVYSDEENTYVRPIKVWERYLPSMFQPHSYNKKTGVFAPLSDSVQISRFYKIQNSSSSLGGDQNMDNWEKFFLKTRLRFQEGEDITPECSRMCDIMLTRDPKLRGLIKEHFTPEDYFGIKDRMIGTGMIGGKACGMLLARKVIENRNPALFSRFEPHDSFYIGSDVFYAYIVDNKFWDIRIRQRSDEEYFSLAENFADHVMNGTFSPSLKEQFMRLLDYYGNEPVIVRSSSILEDGFGNAFAGKYESVFCSNSGSPEKRLSEFENAIRTVYASTMNLSALDYRMRRGLKNKDEQMALLVQRVSGARVGSCFMPDAAGVGYSSSPYHVLGASGSDEGMLRLVCGLGTAAVDRQQGSYPKVVSLSAPNRSTLTTAEAEHKFSQQLVDGVNTETGEIMHITASDIAEKLPFYLKMLFLSHDTNAERYFKNAGKSRDVYYISCSGILRNEAFVQDIKDILKTIQTEYDYPVDMEFAFNFSGDGSYRIQLLQCRPLQLSKDGGRIEVPENPDTKKVLLESIGASMGFSREYDLDYIVYVDPVRYYQMPYKEKFGIKDAVSAVNWYFRGKDKHMILFSPGRICTSSPELGVPTSFADISEFNIVVEIAETRAGYMPELSYGSHIFQDLVEAEILYSAVFANKKTIRFAPDLLEGKKNILPEICPRHSAVADILKVIDCTDSSCRIYYDMKDEHFLCTF